MSVKTAKRAAFLAASIEQLQLWIETLEETKDPVALLDFETTDHTGQSRQGYGDGSGDDETLLEVKIAIGMLQYGKRLCELELAKLGVKPDA